MTEPIDPSASSVPGWTSPDSTSPSLASPGSTPPSETQEAINLQLTGDKLRRELADLQRPYLFRNPQLLTALISSVGAVIVAGMLIKDKYYSIIDQRNQLQATLTAQLNLEAKKATEEAANARAEAAASVAAAEVAKSKAATEAAKARAEATASVAAAETAKSKAATAIAEAARRTKVANDQLIAAQRDLDAEVGSREFASKAEERLSGDPTAARDLAIKAWQRKHTEYARKAIVDAYSIPVLVLEGYTGAISPNGQRVASVGDSGIAWVWDSITGKQLAELEGSRNFGGGTVAFSPDGRSLLTGKATVGVWDATTGKKLVDLKGSRGVAAAFSPDSQRIATGLQGGYVGVWDATTGTLLKKIDGDGDFYSVAFSRDGKRVLTSAGVWDATTGNQLVTFPGHSFGGDSYEGSAAFSPDGLRVVEGAFDNNGVWDAVTGRRLVTLEGMPMMFTVAFLPDGKRVVASTYDNTGWVWDAATGKKLVVLGDPPKDISGRPLIPVGVSPDGQRVVIGSDESAAKVWDTQTGNLVATLKIGQVSVRTAVFSPDGNTVLIGGGFVAIYKVVSPEDVDKFW
jgi:hypothetical protein